MIAEHRRCISELKRLKMMIADMSKYITALRAKGKTLFDSYLVLKKHLDTMTHTLKEMQTQLAQSVEKVSATLSRKQKIQNKALMWWHFLSKLDYNIKYVFHESHRLKSFAQRWRTGRAKPGTCRLLWTT